MHLADDEVAMRRKLRVWLWLAAAALFIAALALSSAGLIQPQAPMTWFLWAAVLAALAEGIAGLAGVLTANAAR